MNSSDKGSTSRNARRAVLLGSKAPDSAWLSRVQDLFDPSKVTLHVVRDGMTAVATAEADKDRISLVVLDAEFPDAISVGRRLAALCASAELVFVANAEEEAVLRSQIGPAARLGAHWSFKSSSAANLPRTLQMAFQRGDERRAMRTTLNRFNAQLAPNPDSSDAKQVQQLLVSDRLLSSILESTFDAIVLVDVHGCIKGFNPSAERLFKRAKAAALDHPVQGLAEGSWKESVNRALEQVADVTALQVPVTIEDESRHLELSITPVSDPNGRFIATSLLVRDVTEKFQAENALRLTEKLAAVGRLASSIAHEINNPLEAVTNLIYVARATAKDEETQQYLDAADHELRRMAAITSQTLRFHKTSIDARAVSAEDLLESVVSVYRVRLMNSLIDVTERFRAKHEVICFDGEIRQVLNNLVGNAIDSMSATGGSLVLRSRDGQNWKTGENGLVLTIADTGYGMNSETIARVYEPFYTTKGIMGTGLGMWISAEIVTQHRGTIHVRSRTGTGRSGTIFSLFLPWEAALRTPSISAG